MQHRDTQAADVWFASSTKLCVMAPPPPFISQNSLCFWWDVCTEGESIWTLSAFPLRPQLYRPAKLDQLWLLFQMMGIAWGRVLVIPTHPSLSHCCRRAVYNSVQLHNSLSSFRAGERASEWVGERVGVVTVTKGWCGRCSVDDLRSQSRLSLRSF